MSEASALSIHVLNVAEGVPAEGVSVELWRLGAAEELVVRTTTGGRTAARTTYCRRPRASRPAGTSCASAWAITSAAAASAPTLRSTTSFRCGSFSPRGRGTTMSRCCAPPWSYTTYRGS